MAPKPTNWALWAKMIGAGALICIGGPALTYYVIPTDEELFQRYNPELKKRSLERRYETEKGFDDFVNKLKEQSKSKQSIWVVQKEEARREKQAQLEESLRLAEETKARKEEVRRAAGLGSKE
ncbi:uncharacterized protein E0L32_008318 [Thyridium curvatum]|uniref:Cytochrome b mRNA-processing protein 4 n=1 Tax=Thyridium curvatum TaxID=1093900 RepID=A0A507B0E6_9PEZI|nr:uncharacterized protein E0L32_008318 [Thyridium curvatum]TPX10749.1 hypothetical protein E0L32_008318 [Thyridium curvatum]